MAEQIFREQFGNNVECKICTTEAELNFDSLQDPGRYDIFVDCGNLQTTMYSLIVDTSEEYGCVKQTRIHEGIVDTRCVNLGGIWSDWELISGNGGSGGISPKVNLNDRADGVEIVVEDADGTKRAIVHDGKPGGYYIPTSLKTAENSVIIGFNSSRSDMQPVQSVKLTAPKGKDGKPGGYYVPSVTQDDAGSFTLWFDPVGEDLEYVPEFPIDFPSENFTAVYRQTTWEELQEALSAGKHIYARYGDNIYVLISLSSKNAYFSRAQQTSIDYVVLNSSNKWSSSSVRIGDAENIKFADGENLEAKIAALEARIAALEG